ncbi:MAG: precorrin-4 C(11)-methyltransferase [Rikenellaceae bacterium]
MKYKIILSSEGGLDVAREIANELNDTEIISTLERDDVTRVGSLSAWVKENFKECDALIFVGAMGIAVRCIAPVVGSKYSDPAVVNVDGAGRWVVSVLSGHIGGANRLTEDVAHIIGAEAVISTQSDLQELWALDTLAEEFGWKMSYLTKSINRPISKLVSGGRVALLLDVRDRGTEFLERTKPSNVDIYYSYEAFLEVSKQVSEQGSEAVDYKLLIVVSVRKYSGSIDTLYYHPQVLHLGMGCRRDCAVEGVAEYIEEQLTANNIAVEALKSISTIELKADEPLLDALAEAFDVEQMSIFTAEALAEVEVKNPSAKVEEVTGSASVSESSAILAAGGGDLILEKHKGRLTEGNDFTFAVAVERSVMRGGHIEIVGAGPGDPDLVSVRGRRFLEAADLILYAGSLVPIELTHCAKQGAVVRSSAAMNLEEQFAIMKEFYDRGLLVVRLHTGDPCIYGAIQEQMAYFDEYEMSYHITPGISSFQAAAAALRSQFTIPEKVQTIILTRGEGRTAMPDKEKLHLLARSQSTMCIFLSASIVEDVERDLLEHYPPHTPVAACYKLTWRDERIYRGELRDLAKIVRENNLTLTTMIVVGEAIDNRQGLSKLYADSFKHLFRS